MERLYKGLDIIKNYFHTSNQQHRNLLYFFAYTLSILSLRLFFSTVANRSHYEYDLVSNFSDILS
jgi:hypothetical protein